MAKNLSNATPEQKDKALAILARIVAPDKTDKEAFKALDEGFELIEQVKGGN